MTTETPRLTEAEIDIWVERWNSWRMELRSVYGLSFKEGSPFTEAIRIITQLRADAAATPSDAFEEWWDTPGATFADDKELAWQAWHQSRANDDNINTLLDKIPKGWALDHLCEHYRVEPDKLVKTDGKWICKLATFGGPASSPIRKITVMDDSPADALKHAIRMTKRVDNQS